MPDPSQDPNEPASSVTRKLAERYGISVEEMEKIIGTSSKTADAAQQEVILPPVEDKPVPPIQAAARVIPSTPPPIHIRPSVPTKPPLTGGLLAAVLTALVIILIIAFSFEKGCFRQRNQPAAAPAVDSIPQMLKAQADTASMPPETPTQTPSSQVPPEALAVPQESPLGTTGPPPPKSVLGKEQQDAGTPSPTSAKSIQTTSNLDAQEKLAEMRAEGYSKARIRVGHRHGVPTFTVSPH